MNAQLCRFTATLVSTLSRCTRRDRGDADSCEHLLDQSVAIVQRLHHQALFSGHLIQKGKGGEKKG